MAFSEHSVPNKHLMALDTVVVKTDKEIDQMVYELYGLSEEEIRIVEGKTI